MKKHGKAIEIIDTELGTIYVSEVLTRQEAMHPSGRMKNHCKYIEMERGSGIYIKNLLCTEDDLMWQMQSDIETGSNKWCERAEGGGAWFGYRVPTNEVEVYAKYEYGEIELEEEPYEIYW